MNKPFADSHPEDGIAQLISHQSSLMFPQTDTVGLQSIEEMSEGHRGTETLHGLTRISAEETNRPSISSRAGPSCQQRDQDKHPSPVGTTPRASFHIGPAEKSKAKRAACADATPFRNLFKTFNAQGRWKCSLEVHQQIFVFVFFTKKDS